MQEFNPVDGVDKINKQGIEIQIRTKLFNICGMFEYGAKSMEELRFEYYTTNRRPLSNANVFFRQPAIDQTPNIFGSNAATTFRMFGSTAMDHRSITSSAPTFSFACGTSGTPARAGTSFMFGSTSSTNLITSMSGSIPVVTCPAAAPLFSSSTSQLPATIAADAFCFATAVRELKDVMRGIDKEQVSTGHEPTSSEKPSSLTTSPEMVRRCADCDKPPQVQCLHCSKQVCMVCAQNHLAHVDEQIEAAKRALTGKRGVLERLSTAAKERVNLEREKIIQQADAQREQALVQIDEILERQKKQFEDKGARLRQLSLDSIAAYIQRLTNEIEDVNEDNTQLFCVTGTPATIQVQYQHE